MRMRRVYLCLGLEVWVRARRDGDKITRRRFVEIHATAEHRFNEESHSLRTGNDRDVMHGGLVTLICLWTVT